MRGDQTLFTRKDEVEAAWRIVGSILNAPAQNEAADGIRTSPSRPGDMREDHASWRQDVDLPANQPPHQSAYIC